MAKEKTAKTSIALPESLLEEFKAYCDVEHRSVSAQIAMMIKDLLKSDVQN